MSGRLIVLGIDAASPELVGRWMAEGKLPALAGLVERGTCGTVAGVDGFFVGSTWPTFYTGLGPAGHGVYRLDQLRSGTYDLFEPLKEPDGVGGTPFWRRASDAGRRVAVLDVPLSRLDRSINGVQTVEWGGHDAVFGFRTAPESLADEISTTVGPYPLPSDCNAHRTTAADFEAFVAGLEDAVARKTALTLDILARERWDLLVQVFTEAHCCGHQCWHLHDPAHPAHDPGLRDRVGDPLERVYRAIDGAVGSIVERAGDARVLVLSAHGMSFFRGAAPLLPPILRRLGVTVRPESPGGTRTRGSRLVGAAHAVWRTLPDAARERLRPLLGALRTDAGKGRGGARRATWVDVDRSRCFPVANGFPVGAIRLNLRGREPRGVLEPGAEAAAFCAELRTALLEIVDERTGQPLIARVARTDELHAGPRRDALPDLLVEWNPATPTGTTAHGEGRAATVLASSPAVGTVEATNDWVRTGEHVPRGIFALAGPGVPASRRADPVPLVDLHPTICRLLGVSAGETDGTPLKEAVAAADGTPRDDP